MVDQSASISNISQSVIVYFRFSNENLEPIHTLERALIEAIVDAQVGVYDGHEVDLLDGDDAYLFMYGPDADRLFAIVQPLLEAASLMQGAEVTLRYGSSDNEAAEERRLRIGR